MGKSNGDCGKVSGEMLRNLFIFLAAAAVSDASYKNLLQGRSQFRNESEVEEFVMALSKLNYLQGALFGVKMPEFDDTGKGVLERLAKERPPRPDMLPYLYEGDIILNKKQIDKVLSETEAALAKRQGRAPRPVRSITSDDSMRWSMPIPYWIDTSTGVSATAVQAGISTWQRLTCVTFQQYAGPPPANNALQFIRGQGCYSYIGMVGGTQQVSIGTGCTELGTVMHEIGHALGFYHEQSRPERDNYVSIQSQNIESQYLGQFSKEPFSAVVDEGVLYNYGSVMHYDGFGFSSDGGYTIVTIDPNYQSTIGQREVASFADVKQINLAYCNSSCSAQLACLNGGYTDPKNCNVCRCPDGFGGILCNRVQSSTSYSCGNGDLVATASMQTVSVSGDADCYYRLTAPAGRNVFIQFDSVLFPNYQPCSSQYAEIKYSSDFVASGFRICGSNQPASITSTTGTAIVIYKGSASTQLVFEYRYDPPTAVAVTPSPSRTTAPPQTTTAPAVISGCTWSSCTASCGGCGTTTTYCTGVAQTAYCNLSPCAGVFCCPPFTWQAGQCVYLGGGGNVWGAGESNKAILAGRHGGGRALPELTDNSLPKPPPTRPFGTTPLYTTTHANTYAVAPPSPNSIRYPNAFPRYIKG